MTNSRKFDKQLSPKNCNCSKCRPQGYKKRDKEKHEKKFYDDWVEMGRVLHPQKCE